MRFLTVALALALSCGASHTAGSQSLSFEPKRVVMDGRSRTAALSLRNTGQKSAAYRISLVDVIYENNGKVTLSSKPPVNFPTARGMVRFSPRQVRLAPGESQRIRILARTPKDFEGEVRVHTQMTQLPDVTSKSISSVASGAVAGALGISQSIAIPIIIRRGQPRIAVKLLEARLVGRKGLKIVVGREGNRSAYVDFIVMSAGASPVAQVRGVAIPVPNDKRIYTMLLDNETKRRVNGATLKIVDRTTGRVLDEGVIR